jgi:hypothetical protein
MDSPIVILVIAVVVAATVAAVIFVKKRTTSGQSSVDFNEKAALVTIADIGAELVEIPITQLPATTVINENSLSEITDRTVISRISELIPTAAQTATRAMADNARNALKGAELVKLDIPFSKLTKSKDLAGAARGYVHGGRGVTAQANLTKVDMTKITKSTAIANGVDNVMNVDSLVVGQYYMTEINAKLEKMNDSINKISDFQDREFKSRIMSFIARTEKHSAFSSEIIENDELRLRTLGTLEHLEGDAAELLGQVNIEITDISKKNPHPSYQEYQHKIDDFCVLVEYQNVLVAVLGEISKLTYILGKGGTSSEMRYSLFNKFLEKSMAARNALEPWSNGTTHRLRL